MNKPKLTIITMSIIILLLLGALFYYIVIPKYNQKIYNKGVSDGQLSLVYSINQNGEVPIIQKDNGNSTIKMINIKDICGGIK